MITRQKANSPSYVTISPPPFCKGGKETSPLCISKGQPPTVPDSALAKAYHIRHASTIKSSEKSLFLHYIFKFDRKMLYNFLGQCLSKNKPKEKCNMNNQKKIRQPA